MKNNLDYYDDYCLFIRQLFMDGEETCHSIEDVYIEDIQSIYKDKKSTGDIKALIRWNTHSVLGIETHLISTIGYLKWLKSIKRNEKLKQLGIR